MNWGQWHEILATIPTLIDGYDYSRVTSMLRDMRFESAEVQSALDGQRYLHGQATALLKRLFGDLETRGGYSGSVQRKNGSNVEGRLTAATMGECDFHSRAWRAHPRLGRPFSAVAAGRGAALCGADH
jgi:hypothetical protein